MEGLINWPLMRQPLNWFIILLMVFIFFMGLDLCFLMLEISVNNKTNAILHSHHSAGS